jgi:hypothetical protein
MLSLISLFIIPLSIFRKEHIWQYNISVWILNNCMHAVDNINVYSFQRKILSVYILMSFDFPFNWKEYFTKSPRVFQTATVRNLLTRQQSSKYYYQVCESSNSISCLQFHIEKKCWGWHWTTQQVPNPEQRPLNISEHLGLYIVLGL